MVFFVKGFRYHLTAVIALTINPNSGAATKPLHPVWGDVSMRLPRIVYSKSPSPKGKKEVWETCSEEAPFTLHHDGRPYPRSGGNNVTASRRD